MVSISENFLVPIWWDSVITWVRFTMSCWPALATELPQTHVSYLNYTIRLTHDFFFFFNYDFFQRCACIYKSSTIGVYIASAVWLYLFLWYNVTVVVTGFVNIFFLDLIDIFLKKHYFDAQFVLAYKKKTCKNIDDDLVNLNITRCDVPDNVAWSALLHSAEDE